MELFHKLASLIAQALAREGVNEAELIPLIAGHFTEPPERKLGHVALPCFVLSKYLRKSPVLIAQQVTALLQAKGIPTDTAGAYCNLHIPVTLLTQASLIQNKTPLFVPPPHALPPTDSYILLEFCSPNIAKRLGFHHIRTTLLGATLARTYRALNYEIKTANYLGDWGKQFASLLAAYEAHGSPSLEEDKSPHHCMDILMEIYKNKPAEAEADKWLRRLESHDAHAVELWKKIRRLSVQSLTATLSRLSVAFDITLSESEVARNAPETLKQLKQLSETRLSDGAYVVDVPGVPVSALIQKSDGTSLYLTRDISLALTRLQDSKLLRCFYIVSEQQRLHFNQLFGILRLLGQPAEKMAQLGYGTVRLGKAKMSTREGNMVLLDAVLDEAFERAVHICTDKNASNPNLTSTAEDIALGAVVFGALSHRREKDIEFNWDEVLNLEGDSGPYIQYALVRAKSLLRKAAFSPEAASTLDGSWEAHYRPARQLYPS